ncbi:hypothetical protein [Candidatus Oscillochloris fontis]|uniref:hypothetical protein n=1 Tax=Candidatus Oscillochloris fontis TaxID=2496868 RepID=UPI00101B6D0B|nr:hypothetical protein [Candidatus Oscillochloris fontis]
MNQETSTNLAERIRSLISLLRHYVDKLLPSSIPRWFWYLFQWVALVVAAIGIYYSWQKFPQDVHIDPIYFSLALGIYVISFGMHILGWHALTRIFFGHVTLRVNIEAIAGSNLVKYLPTIAWYIANRSHFYHARGVAQKTVVVASLSELALMIGSGATLLISLWVSHWVPPFVVVIVFVSGLSTFIWLLARYAGHRSLKEFAYWLVALFWYGTSWPIGILIMWFIMRALVPINFDMCLTIAHIWLLASLASYAMSVTLGVFGIIREITFTVLLAQYWPITVGIAVAIIVKVILTFGQIGCSLILLGAIQIYRRLRTYQYKPS